MARPVNRRMSVVTRCWQVSVMVAIMCATMTATVVAQGVLIGPGPLPRPWPHPHPRPRPVPPATYRVSELAMNIRLDDQVARVQVAQSFVNTGSRTMEVSFVFPLPYDGAVDQMTFLVDGKEIPGKLLTAQEAAKIFQEHVRRLEDPALLQWLGHGIFRTRVFPVPPGAKRTVTLRYSQICRKQFGLTELLIPLRPAQYSQKPVERLKLDINIQSQLPIKNIYSPSHSVQIERSGAKHARVHLEMQHAVPSEDFRLLYDVGDEKVSARVVSHRSNENEDGYFMALVSPELPADADQVQPKTVIFVVDRSGSMSGKKIEQARNALQFVLQNLNSGDLFNIVAYDSEVESFRPELQRYNDKSRKQAMGFVAGINAGGSTNLHGALMRAMEMAPVDSEKPTYVVFLTDGRPTAGVTQEAAIVKEINRANENGVRLYNFGVGFDVNSRLLDKLANGNRGFTNYVRPNEDIEDSVSKLYRRIGAPALIDVKIDIVAPGRKGESAPLVYRVYPKQVSDLFAGDQLVLAGRYRQSGKVKVKIQGNLLGKPHQFEFEGKFVKRSKDASTAYVEKIWAVRRIGEIIDEIDLQGKNSELVQELVRLAQRHGILTPYTSFLADEGRAFDDVAQQVSEAGKRLEMLNETSGEAAFAQRRAKSELKLAQQTYRAAESADQAGSGFGRGAMPGGGSPATRGNQPYGLGKPDRDGTVAMPVRHLGSLTFYFQEGKWVDSRLTRDQIKVSKKYDKFGDEALKLITLRGKELARAVAQDGTLVVLLDGKAVEFTAKAIDPTKK